MDRKPGWLTQVQSLGQEDPLEKEMAAHFIILAWEIPGQRSLEGSSSQGHKGVQHYLVTKQQQQQHNWNPEPLTHCLTMDP